MNSILQTPNTAVNAMSISNDYASFVAAGFRARVERRAINISCVYAAHVLDLHGAAAFLFLVRLRPTKISTAYALYM